MRKPFTSGLTGLALLLLAACGGQQTTTEAPSQESAEDLRTDRPRTLAEATEGPSKVALWKVSDEDTVLYLLGTVHLMRPDVDWKHAKINAAFDQADAVYLEADVFSKEAQRAMGVIVTQTAENPDGVTLSSFYDKKTRERIDEALATMDLSLSKLDAYRPWFASMQVSILALMAAGGDPASGADVVISREMMRREKPLRYLETAAQQMQMLADGDDERDAAYFLDLLDDLEEGEAYYADLMAAWYEGDVERVDYLINDAFEAYPRLRERLLTDRNMDWAMQLDRALTDEPGTFVVAVGAGHLAGEGSLQEMLRSRGYTVERL